MAKEHFPRIRKMDFSLGTAVGLFNSVVALVLVLGTNLASRRLTGKSVW